MGKLVSEIIPPPRRLRVLTEPQAVLQGFQTYIDEQLACIPSMLSGFEDRNPNLANWRNTLARQDQELDGRAVVMLKGFGDGNRGELVGMSHTMADWLKDCKYIREANEADFAARRRKRRRPIKGVRNLHRARLIHHGQ